MDTTGAAKSNDNIDKIQAVLNVLKQQIDQYDFKENSTKSSTEVTRSKKIERLTMKARKLLDQYRKINVEIQYYEKKFEKALKKTVKHMKLQIKENQLKLDTLKRRYSELNAETEIEELVTEKETRPNFKTIGNEKSNEISKPRPKFKPRILFKPINKKIKIKIKTNKKLDKREMLFVNNNNVKQSVTKLVKFVEPPKTLNTQECRITLQRLTEEQMRRYVGPKLANEKQTKQKQASKKSSQQTNKNQLTKEPNWHIKIPKSVLEESQNEGHNREASETSDVENAVSTN